MGVYSEKKRAKLFNVNYFDTQRGNETTPAYD